MPAWIEGWDDEEGLKECFHYQMHYEAGNDASDNSKTEGAQDGQELAKGLQRQIKEDHTRPCKIQYTFDCHSSIDKLIAPLVIYNVASPLG